MTASTGPTCDRCGAGIALTGYRYTKREGSLERELLLCAHHQREHDPALTKQGFACELLDPPEPEAGDKIAGCCETCKGPQFTRVVKASPDSVPVKVTYCKACDARTCNHVLGKDREGELIKCDSLAMTRDDRLCPKGHLLMPEAASVRD